MDPGLPSYSVSPSWIGAGAAQDVDRGRHACGVTGDRLAGLHAEEHDLHLGAVDERLADDPAIGELHEVVQIAHPGLVAIRLLDLVICHVGLL